MTRDEIKAVLAEAGVTDEAKIKTAIDKVLNEHNAEITEAKKVDSNLYVPKADYESKVSELEIAKSGLDKFKDYDDLVKFKNDIGEKQAKEQKLTALENLLKSGNCNSKVINLLAKSVDLGSVEMDDKGNIKDADKLIGTLKSENPDLFTITENKGAIPANAPTGNNSSSFYSKDQINQMSVKDINAHWNEIKESLKNNTGN